MSVESREELSQTRAVFDASLNSLLSSLSRIAGLLEFFPPHVREDVLNLKLSSLDPPRGGIYDISIYERTIFLSQELLANFNGYWKSRGITARDKEWMCRLYFLHELHHVEQKIDSNTYPYSKNSKTIFQPLDYTADSFAVKLSFLIEKEFGNGALSWNGLLAEILRTHVSGGEVFSVLDDGNPPQSIEGTRLHRQMIWHLQHARAYLFRPEASFEEYEIDERMALEIFKIEDKERRTNLCGEDAITEADLQKPLEIHLMWRNQRIRYALTIVHSLKNLSDGLFKNNVMGTVEAFRPFLDERPELTGRPSVNTSVVLSTQTGQRQTSDQLWERLERMAVDLYPYGLVHDEIWSRARGNLSGVNLNASGKGSWHSALRSLRHGGGGSHISPLTLLSKMLDDYPENRELRDLRKLFESKIS